MRAALNQHIPFDVIARWWYLLVGGALLGFIVRMLTGIKPLRPLLEGPITEGPPSHIQVASTLLEHPGWKDALLFAVLGFMVACGLIWLLEEIRGNTQPVGKP